jgi:hypothetical protein
VRVRGGWKWLGFQRTKLHICSQKRIDSEAFPILEEKESTSRESGCYECDLHTVKLSLCLTRHHAV